ncbi:WD40 repeat-like protein [Violaceomyces palustris]|uniref:WD40 repeat-like protein n=1 Tax=Violaceomyces palustris TaxID=1673888 RepID=A0ACD0NMZ3_9BASI|nr:WD40 repeat-like protein [Violaceomyces palustris]
MVRSVTFEIRWHDTQPIYSCSFQPIASNHLRKVLDYNLGQAAGLPPGKCLSDATSSSNDAGSSAGPSRSASSSKLPVTAPAPPVMAGGQSWRLATAGGDNNARLWMVHPNIPSPAAIASAAATSGSAPVTPHPPRVEYLATLSRHSGVVNVVRFCPRGELLATAGDDGNVLFWVPTDKARPTFGDSHPSLEDSEHQFEKEFWRVKLMTRATQQELYDMAWSPNGETLAVGGTDFVARIINVQDGHVIREISEHSHYVQGIAWDPLNELIATQSSDRSVHVHSLHTKSGGHTGDMGGIQTISKNSRLDLHRRNGSNNGTFVWDAHAKPPMQRRGSSHASHASDSGQESAREKETSVAAVRGRTGRSSTPIDSLHSLPMRASTPSHSSGPAAATPVSATPGNSYARAATPTPGASVPPSPFSSASVGPGAHAMNPPQTTPSRRSSFSGSVIDVASPPTSTTSLAPGSHHGVHSSSKLPSSGTDATHQSMGRPTSVAPEPLRRGGSSSRSASRARSVRSPSPIPPLPAIRAPPSPKQRFQATAASGGQLARSSSRLYGDENFSGFFRRLSFSPDGALLVTPSGIFDPPPTPASPTVSMSPGRSPVPLAQLNPAPAAGGGPLNKSAVYLYARGNLTRSNAPFAVLPGHKTASLVVRFSPILYELRKSSSSESDDPGIAPHPTIPLEAGKQKSAPLILDDAGAAPASASSPPPTATSAAPSTPVGQGSGTSAESTRKPSSRTSVIGLPYRMVYAVATQDSVWIYDTQQSGPICCFSNMHYASFTDLTWSPDGQTLMMSSTDGYCSVAVFDYAELGVPYQYGSQPSLHAPVSGVPTPAYHAHGAPTKVSPSTPQHATAVPLGEARSGNATDMAATTGLGLALGGSAAPCSSSPKPASATKHRVSSSQPSTPNEGEPKKKRRIAPTLEKPLGQ